MQYIYIYSWRNFNDNLFWSVSQQLFIVYLFITSNLNVVQLSNIINLILTYIVGLAYLVLY